MQKRKQQDWYIHKYSYNTRCHRYGVTYLDLLVLVALVSWLVLCLKGWWTMGSSDLWTQRPGEGLIAPAVQAAVLKNRNLDSAALFSKKKHIEEDISMVFLLDFSSSNHVQIFLTLRLFLFSSLKAAVRCSGPSTTFASGFETQLDGVLLAFLSKVPRGQYVCSPTFSVAGVRNLHMEQGPFGSL